MPKSLDEIRVAELFVQKGHKIIATNVRLAGVEVDLIVQTPQKEIWFIEVKSPFWPKVSRKQKYRQKKLLSWLSESFANKIFRYHLVTHQNGQLIIQWDYLSES